MSKKAALVSMGYRKLSKDVYAKPVGFNMFTFEMTKLRWTNTFVGADGIRLKVWDSEVYEADKTVNDDFLNHIKHLEANTRMIRMQSEFEFISLEEKISLML